MTTIPRRPPGPPIEFSKYEGLGNDFVLIFVEDVTPDLARYICDRHFGVGADGVIRIIPSSSPDYDFHFRLFNADGGLAEVSGNGLRCVALFLHEAGLWSPLTVRLETGGAAKRVELTIVDGEAAQARVDMGPADVQEPIALFDRLWHRVLTGNPHAVTMVDDVEQAPVADLGPQVEVHEAFPNRTNVEFVQVHGPEEISVRFWERGVGPTLASGSGSTASVVAADLVRAVVHTLGGDLLVEKGDDGHMYQTGPAMHVFDGAL